MLREEESTSFLQIWQLIFSFDIEHLFVEVFFILSQFDMMLNGFVKINCKLWQGGANVRLKVTGGVCFSVPPHRYSGNILSAAGQGRVVQRV